jgi:hypothetical protein
MFTGLFVPEFKVYMISTNFESIWSGGLTLMQIEPKLRDEPKFEIPSMSAVSP